MRGVQRELAHAREGLGEAPGHGVEDLGQAVEFVAVSGAGQGGAQVVFIDALCRPGQGGHRRERPPHHPPAAAQRQQCCGHPAPEDDAVDLAKVVLIRFVGLRWPGRRGFGGKGVIRQYSHGHQRDKHDAGIPERQAGADAQGLSFIT